MRVVQGLWSHLHICPHQISFYQQKVRMSWNQSNPGIQKMLSKKCHKSNYRMRFQREYKKLANSKNKMMQLNLLPLKFQMKNKEEKEMIEKQILNNLLQ